MFSGRNAAAQDDESDKSTAAKSGSRHSSGGSVERQSTSSSPAGAEMEKMQKQLQNFSARQEFDAAARSEPLTIAFDKFDNEEISNSIVAATAESANGGQYYIFPSRSADIGKLKETYGESIIDDENAETIYDVLQSIYENGYNAINVIVRKSKVDEISKLALEQNGALYNYVMMNFIPVEETTIRERYLAGDIFKKGQLIESHDRVGVVIRRGSNHLICLDKDKEMFRSWITDSKEI